MPSPVNSDIPPSSASVVILSAPDTQDNPQDPFHTPPVQASLHSSDVNAVPHSAGSHVLDDPFDISEVSDEMKKFSEEPPVKKLKLGFDEDFPPVNDDVSFRDIPMDKNSVPEENAVDEYDLFREIEGFPGYEIAEGSNVNRSSVEVGEVSDLRDGPVLNLFPDSIRRRSRLENGVASGLQEGIKSFTVFDVLRALTKNSDKVEDDGLTLLETVKRAGIKFPRPSWWKDERKSELFQL